MRRLILVTMLALAAAAAGAQTPDQQTPANEGVCDELIGATPGLYGLCVAYCEAQDCDPVVADQDPESCVASDRKLLDLYNDHKSPADPEMPCVQVTCPCWSIEELESINATECESADRLFFFRTRILDRPNFPDFAHFSETLEFTRFGTQECRYFDWRIPDAKIERIFRLDTEELALCKAQILNRCDELGIPVITE